MSNSVGFKVFLLNQNSHLQEVHKIDTAFTSNLLQAEQTIHHNLTSKIERLMIVEGRVDILIQENRLKVDSNNRLIKTMDSLRLENIQNYKTIEQQNKEINSLNTLRVSLERNIGNLKQLLEESQSQCTTLERAKVSKTRLYRVFKILMKILEHTVTAYSPSHLREGVFYEKCFKWYNFSEIQFQNDKKMVFRVFNWKLTNQPFVIIFKMCSKSFVKKV